MGVAASKAPAMQQEAAAQERRKPSPLGSSVCYGSALEVRLHALGRTDAGRLIHISFTLRGGGRLIRVISARTMHRKERLRYEQES